MEIFEVGVRCWYTSHEFRIGEEGMKCPSCNKVMKIDVWNSRQECFCGNRNLVRARAMNSPAIRFSHSPRLNRPRIEQQDRNYNTFPSTTYSNPNVSTTISSPISRNSERIPEELVYFFQVIAYLFSLFVIAKPYWLIVGKLSNILINVLASFDTVSDKIDWNFSDLIIFLFLFVLFFIGQIIWGIFCLVMFFVLPLRVWAFASLIFNNYLLRGQRRSAWYVGIFTTMLTVTLVIFSLRSYLGKPLSDSTQTTISRTVNPTVDTSEWSFPLSQCGDNNPDGEQQFYPVFVNKTDDLTLQYIRENYCNDAFIKYRESLDIQSIQVASFLTYSQAEEFSKIMIDDPKVNNCEVGNPDLN
jgi:hypothetical protein